MEAPIVKFFFLLYRFFQHSQQLSRYTQSNNDIKLFRMNHIDVTENHNGKFNIFSPTQCIELTLLICSTSICSKCFDGCQTLYKIMVQLYEIFFSSDQTTISSTSSSSSSSSMNKKTVSLINHPTEDVIIKTTYKNVSEYWKVSNFFVDIFFITSDIETATTEKQLYLNSQKCRINSDNFTIMLSILSHAREYEAFDENIRPSKAMNYFVQFLRDKETYKTPKDTEYSTNSNKTRNYYSYENVVNVVDGVVSVLDTDAETKSETDDVSNRFDITPRAKNFINRNKNHILQYILTNRFMLLRDITREKMIESAEETLMTRVECGDVIGLVKTLTALYTFDLTQTNQDWFLLLVKHYDASIHEIKDKPDKSDIYNHRRLHNWTQNRKMISLVFASLVRLSSDTGYTSLSTFSRCMFATFLPYYLIEGSIDSICVSGSCRQVQSNMFHQFLSKQTQTDLKYILNDSDEQSVNSFFGMMLTSTDPFTSIINNNNNNNNVSTSNEKKTNNNEKHFVKNLCFFRQKGGWSKSHAMNRIKKIQQKNMRIKDYERRKKDVEVSEVDKKQSGGNKCMNPFSLKFETSKKTIKEATQLFEQTLQIENIVKKQLMSDTIIKEKKTNPRQIKQDKKIESDQLHFCFCCPKTQNIGRFNRDNNVYLEQYAMVVNTVLKNSSYVKENLSKERQKKLFEALITFYTTSDLLETMVLPNLISSITQSREAKTPRLTASLPQRLLNMNMNKILFSHEHEKEISNTSNEMNERIKNANLSITSRYDYLKNLVKIVKQKSGDKHNQLFKGPFIYTTTGPVYDSMAYCKKYRTKIQQYPAQQFYCKLAKPLGTITDSRNVLVTGPIYDEMTLTTTETAVLNRIFQYRKYMRKTYTISKKAVTNTELDTAKIYSFIDSLLKSNKTSNDADELLVDQHEIYQIVRSPLPIFCICGHLQSETKSRKKQKLSERTEFFIDKEKTKDLFLNKQITLRQRRKYNNIDPSNICTCLMSETSADTPGSSWSFFKDMPRRCINGMYPMWLVTTVPDTVFRIPYDGFETWSLNTEIAYVRPHEQITCVSDTLSVSQLNSLYKQLYNNGMTTEAKLVLTDDSRTKQYDKNNNYTKFVFNLHRKIYESPGRLRFERNDYYELMRRERLLLKCVSQENMEHLLQFLQKKQSSKQQLQNRFPSIDVMSISPKHIEFCTLMYLHRFNKLASAVIFRANMGYEPIYSQNQYLAQFQAPQYYFYSEPNRTLLSSLQGCILSPMMPYYNDMLLSVMENPFSRSLLTKQGISNYNEICKLKGKKCLSKALIISIQNETDIYKKFMYEWHTMLDLFCKPLINVKSSRRLIKHLENFVTKWNTIYFEKLNPKKPSSSSSSGGGGEEEQKYGSGFDKILRDALMKVNIGNYSMFLDPGTCNTITNCPVDRRSHLLLSLSRMSVTAKQKALCNILNHQNGVEVLKHCMVTEKDAIQNVRKKIITEFWPVLKEVISIIETCLHQKIKQRLCKIFVKKFVCSNKKCANYKNNLEQILSERVRFSKFADVTMNLHLKRQKSKSRRRPLFYYPWVYKICTSRCISQSLSSQLTIDEDLRSTVVTMRQDFLLDKMYFVEMCRQIASEILISCSQSNWKFFRDHDENLRNLNATYCKDPLRSGNFRFDPIDPRDDSRPTKTKFETGNADQILDRWVSEKMSRLRKFHMIEVNDNTFTPNTNLQMAHPFSKSKNVPMTQNSFSHFKRERKTNTSTSVPFRRTMFYNPKTMEEKINASDGKKKTLPKLSDVIFNGYAESVYTNLPSMSAALGCINKQAHASSQMRTFQNDLVIGTSRTLCVSVLKFPQQGLGMKYSFFKLFMKDVTYTEKPKTKNRSAEKLTDENNDVGLLKRKKTSYSEAWYNKVFTAMMWLCQVNDSIRKFVKIKKLKERYASMSKEKDYTITFRRVPIVSKERNTYVSGTKPENGLYYDYEMIKINKSDGSILGVKRKTYSIPSEIASTYGNIKDGTEKSINSYYIGENFLSEISKYYRVRTAYGTLGNLLYPPVMRLQIAHMRNLEQRIKTEIEELVDIIESEEQMRSQDPTFNLHEHCSHTSSSSSSSSSSGIEPAQKRENISRKRKTTEDGDDEKKGTLLRRLLKQYNIVDGLLLENYTEPICMCWMANIYLPLLYNSIRRTREIFETALNKNDYTELLYLLHGHTALNEMPLKLSKDFVTALQDFLLCVKMYRNF